MNASTTPFAQLSSRQVAQIQQLETKLDSVLVAVKQDANVAAPPELALASVSDSELADLQENEQALGVILLAYNALRLYLCVAPAS